MDAGDQAREIGFRQGTHSPRATLAFREFRLFFVATAMANVAQWMQQFAVGWLVIELAIREGHPERGVLYLGFTGLARLIPALVFGAIGGVMADRFDRRSVLMATRALSGVIAATIAVLLLTDRINVPLAILLTTLSAAVFSVENPARLSVVPSLVAPAAALTAIGMVRAAQQASLLVGPLLGGLLVGPIGVTGVFLVNAAMYAFAGVGLGGLRPIPPHASVRASDPLTSFREGLAYVGRVPTLKGFMLATVMMTVFASSYTQLMPAVAHDTLKVGAVELSWLMSATGLGSLLGAVLITTMGSWPRPGRVLLVDAFALGTLLVLFGLQTGYVPALLVASLLGFVSMTYNGGTGNVIQMTVPNQLRGRTMGLYSTTFQTGTQLGTLLLGTLGSLIGISNAIALAGAVILVTVAVMSRNPAIREAGTALAPAVGHESA